MKAPLWLEVVCAPVSTGLEPGQRFELSGSIGRDPTINSISVPLDSIVGRRHCKVGVGLDGRPWLEDLGSTNGTYVNGSRCRRVELEPGDVIELPWGVVFRVSPCPALSFDPKAELPRLVAEDPHDDGRWRVWADQLLEAGDPLGPRIARGRGADAVDEARALGPLARELVEGGLEIEWRHGFVQHAVLRNRDRRPWPPRSWLDQWQQLLAHPLAYFVEELEVDALSYARGIDSSDRDEVAARIVTSLDVLARAARLPLLKSVRFGPTPRQLWSRELQAAWRRAIGAHASLLTGPIWVARQAWLQLLATPPKVNVIGLEVGASAKLREDAANLIGPLSDCSFVLEAPDGSPSSAVALSIDRENGLWIAEDMADERRRKKQPLHVNGRAGPHQRIRPGDVLEPAPGLLFRFVME